LVLLCVFFFSTSLKKRKNSKYIFFEFGSYTFSSDGLFLLHDQQEDIQMAKKPTYEELEQTVKEFEKEFFEHKAVQQAPQSSEQRLSLINDSVADRIFKLLPQY